jgi:lysophospholipase L1-like esterase
LICFGDSITRGAGASVPSTSYAAIVARALGLTLDNRAIGGTRLAQQPIVPVKKGDVALLLTGFNDMRYGVNLVTYRTTLTHAIAVMGQYGATVLLGDCLRMRPAAYALYPPFDRGSDAAVVAINAVIHAMTGVRHVAASAAFDPLNTIADQVHPNDAGHAQIAVAFVQGAR